MVRLGARTRRHVPQLVIIHDLLHQVRGHKLPPAVDGSKTLQAQDVSAKSPALILDQSLDALGDVGRREAMAICLDANAGINEALSVAQLVHVDGHCQDGDAMVYSFHGG